MTALAAIDLSALDARGFCAVPDMVGAAHLETFERQIAEIGGAECEKLGLDPGPGDALAAAMGYGDDYRTFLFNKVKHLWVLAEMTSDLVCRLERSGLFDHLGIVTPGVYQTIKIDLPGDDLYTLPFHQDYKLTKSYRSCRLWVALREVNKTCGSMELAVASHRETFAYVALDSDYPHIDAAEIEDRFETETLRLPAGAGAVFDPMIVHRTVPNRGRLIRFSLIVHIDDLTALHAPDDLNRLAPNQTDR